MWYSLSAAAAKQMAEAPGTGPGTGSRRMSTLGPSTGPSGMRSEDTDLDDTEDKGVAKPNAVLNQHRFAAMYNFIHKNTANGNILLKTQNPKPAWGNQGAYYVVC